MSIAPNNLTRAGQPMSDKEREEKMDALKRYEQTRREHLGGAINIVFGLSAAATGFCLSRITDKDTHFTRPGSYFFILATIIFTVTVCTCIVSTWTRLRDFRLTVCKLRRELEGADANELKRLGSTTSRLGRWTWRLFYAQLTMFGLGVAVLAVALLLLYSDHVFPRSPSPNATSEPTPITHDGVSR